MTTVRLGPPVTAGSLTIRPIERVSVEGAHTGCGLVAFASKEPVALLLRTPDGDFAVGVAGEPASLGDVLRSIPDLPERLAE